MVFCDIAFMVGLFITIYGISLLSVAAAFIFGGLALAVLAYLAAEEKSEPKQPDNE